MTELNSTEMGIFKQSYKRGGTVMQKATEALELWLNQEDLEKTLKEELATLKDENEIYERF